MELGTGNQSLLIYSTNPEYHLKKKRIEDLKYRNLSLDSVLFYEDKKGSIVAKTYGNISRSSVQFKVSRLKR